MAEPAVAVLSVRGDARRMVAPDFALLNCGLSVTRDSKQEALRVVAAVQQSLEGDLAGLGAVPRTVESDRAALTWSAQSVTTQEEHDFDESRRHGPTGRVTADVSIILGIRALDRLDELAGVLAGHEALNVHYVGWYVDADNPNWPAVRAEAIHAAIAKGRDYASALGGALLRVEQIADVGLLDGESGARRAVGLGFRWAESASFSADTGGSPSLDPVPQGLMATIDARFVASVAPLTDL